MKKLIKVRNSFFNKVKHLYYSGTFGTRIELRNVKLGKAFHFDIASTDYKIIFKPNVHFRNNSVVCIRNTGKLTIGENVFFNTGISINCHNHIIIGNDCLFGENVKLYDHNHKFRDKNIPIRTQGYSYGTIKIGNNCWIGSNAVILKNVDIGDNVVIGAGCVISDNIPSNTIVKTKNILEVISY